MKFKLIKTEDEYNEILRYIETLADREDFESNQELIDEFELLSALIEIYDKEHYSLPSADPIEIITLKMEYMGLSRKDLSHIASSGVLSEVFNRKRALSKQMIREFAKLLEIDQSLLNIPYKLSADETVKVRRSKPIRTSNRSPKATQKAADKYSPFKYIDTKIPELEGFKLRVRNHNMLLNYCCY